MGKRVFSAMIALVLALGLSPASAFADGLEAGRVQQRAVSVQASAKKTTVWVAASMTRGSVKDTFKYNAKGQLVKVTGGSQIVSYAYKADRIASYTVSSKYAAGKTTGKLSYDKKGRLAKKVEKSPDSTDTVAYSHDKKGRITKESRAFKYFESVEKSSTSYAYGVSGRISKRISTVENGAKTITKFSYDKKGNLLKSDSGRQGGYRIGADFANTYRSGRLAKRGYSRYTPASSSPAVKFTMSYTYKKLAVPKAYVAQVKAQQWALFNNTVSLELPCGGFGG